MSLYTPLEDKWYDIIDTIDSKIPIGGIIDKIDSIFPSFILFLIIIILITTLIIFNISFSGTKYTTEITVLNLNELPLADAQISILTGCGNEELIINTNDNGKAIAIVCSENITLTVSKNGYYPNKINSNAKDKQIIKLQPKITNSERQLRIYVNDKSKTIKGAEIDFICNEIRTTYSEQTSEGFYITSVFCNFIQIVARAEGFEEKTITIENTDTRVNIELERRNLIGKLIIEATQNNDPINNLEVLFTNSVGENFTRRTEIFGLISEDLTEGEYTYSADNNGDIKTGTFTISAGSTESLQLSFEKQDIPVENQKYLAFEILDENNEPIYLAEVKVYKDNTQIGGVQKTNQKGKTTPKLINTQLSPNSTYQVIVNATGYTIATTPAQLLETEQYQKIVLEKGNSTLKIKTLNDRNEIEANAFVQILKGEFVLEKGYTDKNGEIKIENLPSGEVTIKANDKYKKDFANENITLQKNSTKEIILFLRTGEGQIKYYFENLKGDKISPNIKIYDINGLINTEITKNGYYQTTKFKVGTKINLENNDKNFMPYMDFTYTIDATTKEKTVYLIDELPNQNNIQLFLTDIYPTNPLYSNVNSNTKVKKLVDGKKYWFYFLAVVNTESEGTLVSNFNLNNSENKVFINDAFSTKEYTRIMTSQKKSKYIDQVGDVNTLVDERAKQVNLSKNLSGKIVIPIILPIEIDANYDGNFEIEYYGRFGTEDSLVYTNNFIIGETFCTTNCPVFTFDNFIIDGTNEKVIEEDTTIYLGDNYSVKTIIKNLSDKELGAVVFTNQIDKTSLSKLTFRNDANSVSKNVILNPKTSVNGGTSDIITKKVGRTSISQKITKSGDSDIEKFEGNNTYFKLNIAEKKQISIEVSPGVIDEGGFYPVMIISTKYLPYQKTSAYWKTKMIIDGITTELELTGTTDENGTDFISFDASKYGLKKGDKIIFTAYDNFGSLEGSYEMVVVDSFEIIEEPDECLTVELNGIPYIENETYTTININETTNLKIISACDIERQIYLTSDLELSKIRTFVPANDSTNIVINGKPRGNLLGTYPLQIFAQSGNKISQIALVDVIIKDPNSCFDLEQAIFDFRTTGTISSKVTNKCFEGRKDNFYPQMNQSTNSINLNYNKPGTPETYKFTAKVIGAAVESFVEGFVWKTGIKQTHYGDHCGNPFPISLEYAPDSDSFSLEEVSTTICKDVVDDILKWEVEEKGTWEPPEKITPTNPTWTSSEIISEDEIKSNDFNNSELASEKIVQIHFSEDTSMDETGNPQACTEGDIYSVYPTGVGTQGNIIGNFENCSVKYHISSMSSEWPEGWGTSELLAANAPEKRSGYVFVIDVDHCDPCQIPYFSFGEGYDATITTRGQHFWHGDLQNDNYYTAILDLELEDSRTINFLGEQRAEWTKEVEIKPDEGKVYSIGVYSAAPIPKWKNIDTVKGVGIGETFTEGTKVGKVTCIEPMGFVPPQKANSFDLGDPEKEKTLEYSVDGLIKYFIPAESIPEDLDVYLYNGQYYAEYVGVPTVPGKNIDFTLSTNNLLGKEYAILEIADWTGGDTKEKRAFQIKLIGNEHNCFSPEGIEGFTGKEYSPRLLFDWDWQKISQNQCETTNNAYTYCDATQFTISLFKKLELIENYLKEGREKELPKYTSFYTYLIKDNYSKKFLTDFVDYYSTEFTASNPEFTKKFKNLITENKLNIEINETGGKMPYGGLYQVGIEIENVENINSLFDENTPLSEITITLNPKSKAKNYNPLYEMPFDGPVGGTEKLNYGTGFNGTLPLNDNVKLSNIISLNHKELFTTNSLSELDNSVLLRVDNDNIYFYPAQPTPISIMIESTNGKAEAKYSIQPSSDKPYKNWQLTASNIGYTQCVDFETMQNKNYNAFNNSGIYSMLWNGTKAGKITLSTIFFTPPNSTNYIKPENTTTKLSGPTYLKNNENYFLDNYDSQGIKYTTIKDMFDMIGNEKVCMGNNSDNELLIFWNPEYLGDLIESTVTDSKSKCNGDIIFTSSSKIPENPNENNEMPDDSNTQISDFSPNDASNEYLFFGGAFGDYVKVPNKSSLNLGNEMTLEAWIYPTKLWSANGENPDAPTIIISKGMIAEAWDYRFYIDNSGKLSLDGGTKTSSSVIRLNQWQHVAVTINKSTNNVKFYVNGIQVPSQGGVPNFSTTSNNLQIGRSLPSSWSQASWYYDNFKGKMDEIRIWNKVLTGSQINENMNKSLTGNEQNLMAYWNFETDDAKDLTSNNNNGQIIGNCYTTNN